MARRRLGELLLERGFLTRDQLDEALAAQRSTRQRLGVTLIQKGFVTEDALVQALAEAMGLPLVDLRTVPADWTAVHALRPRFCETNELFPFAIEQPRGQRRSLKVAMTDPLNIAAIEEIEFITGMKVLPHVAPVSAVRAAVLRYYHKVEPSELPEGQMLLIQRGGGARVVDTTTVAPAPAPAAAAPPRQPGQSEVSERTALADLISQRERQRKQKRRKGSDPARAGELGSLSEDLNYLFGMGDEPEALEVLERKFWALMRIMAKKGLITKDEFTRELDDAEDEG
jgi:hypothetical protein